MRHATVFTAALLCACAAMAAGSHRTTWELSNYTWVKLVSVEKGADPVQHPALLDAGELRRNLARITIGEETLFEAKELETLLKPIQEAFSSARPDEEVVLLSTNRRGAGILATAYGVTARLFVQGGMVNVLVHDTRMDFVNRARANDMVPFFVYGSRASASSAVLGGLTARRADWVVFPVAVAPAPVREVIAAPLSNPEAAPVPVMPTVVPPVVPPAAKPAATVPENQEARLRTLKRLREQNLITEDEYQKKRKEILESL